MNNENKAINQNLKLIPFDVIEKPSFLGYFSFKIKIIFYIMSNENEIVYSQTFSVKDIESLDLKHYKRGFFYALMNKNLLYVIGLIMCIVFAFYLNNVIEQEPEINPELLNIYYINLICAFLICALIIIFNWHQFGLWKLYKFLKEQIGDIHIDLSKLSPSIGLIINDLIFIKKTPQGKLRVIKFESQVKEENYSEIEDAYFYTFYPVKYEELPKNTHVFINDLEYVYRDDRSFHGGVNIKTDGEQEKIIEIEHQEKINTSKVELSSYDLTDLHDKAKIRVWNALIQYNNLIFVIVLLYLSSRTNLIYTRYVYLGGALYFSLDFIQNVIHGKLILGRAMSTLILYLALKKKNIQTIEREKRTRLLHIKIWRLHLFMCLNCYLFHAYYFDINQSLSQKNQEKWLKIRSFPLENLDPNQGIIDHLDKEYALITEQNQLIIKKFMEEEYTNYETFLYNQYGRNVKFMNFISIQHLPLGLGNMRIL